MANHEMELKRYHRINGSVEPNCAVFFGSDTFSGIPVGELTHDEQVETPVYNRSIAGLRIREAEQVVKECVYELNPAKVFINLGENDIAADGFDEEQFITDYEWLLYNMNRQLQGRAQLYVVSVLSAHPMTMALNQKLQSMAEESGCVYVDVMRAINGDQLEVQIYDCIRKYLRSHAIGFAEAFRIAAV